MGWGAPAVEAEAHCGQEDTLLLLARLLQAVVNQVKLVAVGAGFFGRQQPRFLHGEEQDMTLRHMLITRQYQCTKVLSVTIGTAISYCWQSDGLPDRHCVDLALAVVLVHARIGYVKDIHKGGSYATK